jgi:Sigma-70, region 4
MPRCTASGSWTKLDPRRKKERLEEEAERRAAVRNIVLDAARKPGPLGSDHIADVAREMGLDPDRFDALIHELPGDQFRAFTHLLLGHSVEELAQQMGRTERALRVLLDRAYHKVGQSVGRNVLRRGLHRVKLADGTTVKLFVEPGDRVSEEQVVHMPDRDYKISVADAVAWGFDARPVAYDENRDDAA